MKKIAFFFVSFFLFSSSPLYPETVCQFQQYIGNPQNIFPKNGNISNGNAPVTFAPVIALTSLGSFSLPITVNDFTDIGALTLYLEYDPAIITYQNSFTKNSAFGSSFLVGNIQGTGNKMQIIIQWYIVTGGVSLPNGSTLCTLNFSFPAASPSVCALNWDDSGPSCEYSDGSGNVLNDLPTSDYYINGSVTLTLPLAANFISDNLAPPKNTTVHFTDLSTGGATSWSWSFNRTSVVFMNGTSASSQNPLVQFTDGGLYTVTLVVHKNLLSNTMIKTDYIRAGISGIWTGNTSSEWNTLSNWDNYLVPGSGTNVVIPPLAINWPVFSGNLILGIQCGSLTLSGTTSKMTITGVLTIP